MKKTFFDNMQVLPSDGKFINKNNLDNDELFMEIADIVKKMLAK